MSDSVSKKVLEYTAVFEPAEEGGYVVTVPALPGCATQGETFEEASSMIKDALEGCLAVLKEEGQEIPQESSETVVTRIRVGNPVIS